MGFMIRLVFAEMMIAGMLVVIHDDFTMDLRIFEIIGHGFSPT